MGTVLQEGGVYHRKKSLLMRVPQQKPTIR
jgi:hypothetical protein